MDDIDYGQFLTPRPQQPSGRKLLWDTFQALAEAKRKKELAQMEDERLRRANDLTFQSSMYGHGVTRQNAMDAEAGRGVQRAETERANRARERQQMTDAQAKLFENPDFRAAIQSQDPRALEQWRLAAGAVGAPIESEMGRGDTPPELAGPGQGQTSVEPPPLTTEQAEGAPMQSQPTGQDIDRANEVLDVYQPVQPTGRQRIGGVTFDPKMNADLAMARAKQGRDVIQAAAGDITDPMTAEATRNAGVRFQALRTLGYSDKDALDKLGQGIDAEAGRANARRNADVAGANARTIKPGQKVDNERALATSAKSLLDSELNREDYKEQIRVARENALIAKELESNNAAAHKRAMGLAAKQAAGPGAVTEDERNYFVNTVGGKSQQLRQLALTWLAGGEVPEETRRIFADAYRNILMRHNREVLEGIQTNVRDSFASHPNADFHQYADWAANRVAPTILGAKRGTAKPVGGGGTPAKSVDDYMNMLGGPK